jgi:hypothetical protein
MIKLSLELRTIQLYFCLGKRTRLKPCGQSQPTHTVCATPVQYCFDATDPRCYNREEVV